MLQNLLSKQQKKTLSQEYYLRLTAVASLILTVAFVVGLIALLPSYMEVVDELELREGEQLAKEKDKQDMDVLCDDIEKTDDMLGMLEGSLAEERLSVLLVELMKERPEGIAITGFSYTRDKNTLSIEGVAATRSLVVPFARDLEANEYFKSVPVHITDLAKNTDLEFHLNIELADVMEKTAQ